ncbi:YybH family protein [Aquimarina algicola]|uniref:DUF4440 domain-containing protein n=1 Tax=Aquimarina algicola TaxID=2589995 RepID=A0A504JLW5_9FLAO|nr:DUF4440 domain-containing protein [Aquimarina algicola]TPN87779.1 DUF4440 domain-containing protein [Aquimarina algicola]
MNESLVKEVRNALDQWLEAFNNNDIEALMSVYDSEIVYANSAKPIEIGIPMVKEGFIKSFGIKPKVFFKEEQAIAVDDLGYIAGQFRVAGTSPEDGSAVGESGRVVVIFRRNEVGEWKLVFDMDNRPPDVTI